jgi:hypothetical protein
MNPMNMLYIALQDGFKNDSLRITVNGQDVYKKNDVTTNLVISLADSIETSVDDGTEATVKVEADSRNVTNSVVIQPSNTPYLAVSIGQNNKIEFIISKEPFRYM